MGEGTTAAPAAGPVVTEAAKREMLRDGFTVIRNVVQRPLLDVAVRAINAELGKGVNQDDLATFKNGILFPTLMMRPAITELFHRSAAREVAAAFLGSDHHRVGGGQIALRFPGAFCIDEVSFTPAPWTSSAWHIDGLTDENERFAKKGTIGNFSCLLGVALRDVPEPNRGNLIVYPASHRVLEAAINADATLLPRLANDGEKGLPQYLPFEPAKQVCMNAGDVVLCHYQTAHSVAANSSPDIRYVVYFRVHGRGHPPGQYRPEAMKNIWLDWAGMRTIVDKELKLLPPIDLSRVSAAPRGDDAPSSMNSSRSKSSRPVPSVSPERFQELIKQANAAFDAEQWAAAREPFQILSDTKPTDFNYALKATVSTGLADPDFKESTEYHRTLVAFAQRTIDLAPDLVAGHCMRVRGLVGMGQHDEALLAFQTVRSVPKPSDATAWAHGLVVDSLKCAIMALQQLNRWEEVPGLMNSVSAQYPALKDALKGAAWTPATMALVKQTEAVMATEPKDWKRGQELFTKLLMMAPDNVDVLVQTAACFTYGSMHDPAGLPTAGNMDLLRIGERHARTIVAVDPTCLAGYGVLARNLVFQGRFAEVPPVTDAMLNCRLQPQFMDLLVDGFRSLRQAYIKMNQQNLVAPAAARFRQTFPECGPRFDAVLTETNCVIL